MSMRNYANHGYVVPVMDLAPLLKPGVTKADLEKVLRDFAAEDDVATPEERIERWLIENMQPFTPFVSVFILRAEDESDDLEIGMPYVEFDEADLFILMPSDMNLKLAALGITPKDQRWVTFS